MYSGLQTRFYQILSKVMQFNKIFQFWQNNIFQYNTFCHVRPPTLLVKNICLKIISGNIISFQRARDFFSVLCALPLHLQLKGCRNKQAMLQRRPLLWYISLGARSAGIIVRQTIIKISSLICKPKRESHCLDMPFEVCPKPALGHLRVQEKTSVT